MRQLRRVRFVEVSRGEQQTGFVLFALLDSIIFVNVLKFSDWRMRCPTDQEEGWEFGRRCKAVCDSARKTGNGPQGDPRDHQAHEHEAEETVDHHGAIAKVDERSPRRKFGRNSSRRSWSWTTGSGRRKLSCSRK